MSRQNPDVTPERELGAWRVRADSLGERGEHLARPELALEERQRIVGRFEEAGGLRFERESDGLAGFTLDPHELGSDQSDGVRDRARRSGLGARGEATGHGADASGRAFGEKRAEHASERERVRDSVVLEPIGAIDALLHARAVERAVRKAVQRENVEAGGVELAPSGLECAGNRRELGGGECREPEPHAEGSVGTNAPFDVHDVRAEGLANLVPRLAGMDVGAVREMRPVRRLELHAEPPRSASHAMAAATTPSSRAVTSRPRPMRSSSVTLRTPPRCSRKSSRPARTARRSPSFSPSAR